MATIQKRKSRGHTYWSIVESRRVNGKPRPVILAYLGTAEALLKKLQEGIPQKVKSYNHGLVVALLATAEELEIVQSINRHLPQRQLRDGFTVGGSVLLAAIGRVCQATSKRGWYKRWAKSTSLSYLLGKSLNKLDSQHFWDQMEALPPQVIPLIEEDILKTLVEKYNAAFDTLLCDATNFFTYIASSNKRCQLARRGRNKQKRMDLRQFGLLLVLSRQDQLPLFHQVYQGNFTDRTIFKQHLKVILERFKHLAGSLEDITLIFDQGNNSKKTLKEVVEKIHFVGALSPHHHQELIKEANRNLEETQVGGRNLSCYRTRTSIWGLDLTCVVYISEKLRQGQIRGLEQDIKKLFGKLNKLKEKLKTPTKRGKKRTESAIEKKLQSLIASHVPCDLIRWELKPLEQDAFSFSFWIDTRGFNRLQEEQFGRRILITNRHQWRTEEIILAYWGQSRIESAFKRMKNPFQVPFRPQYHWTDQKIKVHAFICVIAFLLVMVIYKKAKEKCGFTGSPLSLLEKLYSIRLATFIEAPSKKTKGRYKATCCLEEMDPDVKILAEGLGLTKVRPKINIPFSVYN